MGSSPMTDATRLYLEESIKNGGRAAADRSGSKLKALIRRGYMTRAGEVTEEGRQAAFEEKNYSLHKCCNCGASVRCIHEIPMGSELCGKCTGARPKAKGGSTVQDFNYHGDGSYKI